MHCFNPCSSPARSIDIIIKIFFVTIHISTTSCKSTTSCSSTWWSNTTLCLMLWFSSSLFSTITILSSFITWSWIKSTTTTTKISRIVPKCCKHATTNNEWTVIALCTLVYKINTDNSKSKSYSAPIYEQQTASPTWKEKKKSQSHPIKNSLSQSISSISVGKKKKKKKRNKKNEKTKILHYCSTRKKHFSTARDVSLLHQHAQPQVEHTFVIVNNATAVTYSTKLSLYSCLASNSETDDNGLSILEKITAILIHVIHIVPCLLLHQHHH